MSNGVTPTSNISTGIGACSAYNNTAASDPKQNEIMARISQLEKELNHFKKANTTHSSLTLGPKDTSFSASLRKPAIREVSPCFSLGNRSNSVS